ncbi:MAG: hypothetical protein ACOC33_00060 [bacterium]
MVFDEIDLLISHRNYTFNELMDMPTYLRRYFLNRYNEELYERKKQQEKAEQKSKRS